MQFVCYYNQNCGCCYGLRGPTGAQGPQGVAGENATITIGTTTTGAPGTAATVTNTGTPQNAILNFTIPQGEPGTAVTLTYIDAQNQTAQTITAADTVIPLTLVGNQNINFANNIATIIEAGLYRIDYMVSANSATTATIGLRINGTNNAQTTTAISDGRFITNYQTVLNLTAGTTIELIVVAVTGTLTLNSGTTNAVLVITKL